MIDLLMWTAYAGIGMRFCRWYWRELTCEVAGEDVLIGLALIFFWPLVLAIFVWEYAAMKLMAIVEKVRKK